MFTALHISLMASVLVPPVVISRTCLQHWSHILPKRVGLWKDESFLPYSSQIPGPPKTSLFPEKTQVPGTILSERRKKKEERRKKKEERRKKKEEEERADRNRSPSTIARTGPFCSSRAWKPPHSDNCATPRHTCC